VNVAPAIVALQRQFEAIRQGEVRRIQARLGALTAEQVAAVEALTRGLVNKFLHPPMQALKQAARENDATRMEALCETWSLPSAAPPEAGSSGPQAMAEDNAKDTSVTQSSVAGRR
jgi:glutamyl-tRNA reductase